MQKSNDKPKHKVEIYIYKNPKTLSIYKLSVLVILMGLIFWFIVTFKYEIGCVYIDNQY